MTHLFPRHASARIGTILHIGIYAVSAAGAVAGGGRRASGSGPRSGRAARADGVKHATDKRGGVAVALTHCVTAWRLSWLRLLLKGDTPP